MNLESQKKTIKVVAALIEVNGKIFCAQRAYGELKGKWEFPGGKVEVGETNEQALVREIKEELDTTIVVDSFFTNVVYEYPTFILDMDVYRSHVSEGRLEVEDGIHLAEKFVPVKELEMLDWCPADFSIAEKIRRNIL